MGTTKWLVTGAMGLLVAGCGSNDVIIKKQTEMEARIEQLVQGYTAANARLSDLSGEMKDLQLQVRKNSADLEDVKPSLKDVKSSLEAVQRNQAEPVRVSAPAAVPDTQPPAAKIEVINREPSPRDKAATAQDVYMKAFGLFSANDYKQAVTAFESFIKTYPESEYAGNARYWIGECYYTQRDFKPALESFRRVISDYPKGNKVPDAMLKLGLTQISLNDQAGARETFKSLVEKYPKSQAAAKAKERLSKH